MVQATSSLEDEYWSGLKQGLLKLPRCGGCNRWQWPAPARCGECGHWGSTWHDLPMSGRVFSWTRTWHPFDGLESLSKPFVSLIVEIDGTDGVRLMGLLDGDDDGENIGIGSAVTGTAGSTEYADEDIPVIVWQLAN